MGKQPYIPFYIGDYLKDTRVLPLNVRGAWVDLILFMWDNPVRGELIGTIQEIARMIGCDIIEAKFALDLLKQKKTADIDLLPTGEFKIVSRRMKKDFEISQKRSEAGKNGVDAKKQKAFAEAKGQAKQEQKPEYEYDNEIDNNLNKNESKNFDEIFAQAFDDITCDRYAMTFRELDLASELQQFKIKCDNDPDSYHTRDAPGLRTAFQYQLKNSKPKLKNGKQGSITAEGTRDRLNSYSD